MKNMLVLTKLISFLWLHLWTLGSKLQYIHPEKVGAVKMRLVSEIMDEEQGQDQDHRQGQAGSSRPRCTRGATSGPPLPLGLTKKQNSLGSFFNTPLDWWTIHEHNFPRLSRMAEKHLCIPTISTHSYFHAIFILHIAVLYQVCLFYSNTAPILGLFTFS